MTIKKSLLIEGDALASWNKLGDDYELLFGGETYDEMDETKRTYYLLFSAHYQILNGGVIQFIDNSTGDYFHETIEAARKVGFTEFAEILTKAASVFPDLIVPSNWYERRETVDALNDLHTIKGAEYDYTSEEWESFWEDLDKSYFANETKLYPLAIKYLVNNAELID